MGSLVRSCPVENDLAGRRLVELGDGAERRGLAAAGFAHETQGLALADREIDAVDGVDEALLPVPEEALAGGEVHLEAADLQQIVRSCYFPSE